MHVLVACLVLMENVPLMRVRGPVGARQRPRDRVSRPRRDVGGPRFAYFEFPAPSRTSICLHVLVAWIAAMGNVPSTRISGPIAARQRPRGRVSWARGDVGGPTSSLF